MEKMKDNREGTKRGTEAEDGRGKWKQSEILQGLRKRENGGQLQTQRNALSQRVRKAGREMVANRDAQCREAQAAMESPLPEGQEERGQM